MARVKASSSAKKNDNGSARARILETAVRLFSDHPFGEISAAEIAQQAGVAHGLMFHYFGSKTKLYEEICKQIAHRMDRVHMSALDNGEPAERLRCFLDTHMDEVWRHRKNYVFNTRGGGTKAIQAIWEDSRRIAIMRILEVLGVANPSSELVVATRAWLGFFDELVAAWVEGKIDNKGAVVRVTLRQLPVAFEGAALLGAGDALDIPDKTMTAMMNF